MNPIAEFLEQGKDLNSKEGEKLIKTSEIITLKDALRDPKIAAKMIVAHDASKDPFFRRKIIRAFSGY